MTETYLVQKKPYIVPTSDGKLIEEHFGREITNDSAISIAHMIAPPDWSEPFQKPEFDEYTLIVKGRKQIEIDEQKVILNVGESLLVKRGSRVRYSNPFDEEVEYWSVCIPAFSLDLANRE